MTMVKQPNPQEYVDPAGFIVSWHKFSRGEEPLPPSVEYVPPADLEIVSGIQAKVEDLVRCVLGLQHDEIDELFPSVNFYYNQFRGGTATSYTGRDLVDRVLYKLLSSYGQRDPAIARFIEQYPVVKWFVDFTSSLNQGVSSRTLDYHRRAITTRFTWRATAPGTGCPLPTLTIPEYGFGPSDSGASIQVRLLLKAYIVPTRCRAERGYFVGSTADLAEILSAMPVGHNSLNQALAWWSLRRHYTDGDWPHVAASRAVAMSGEFSGLHGLPPRPRIS